MYRLLIKHKKDIVFTEDFVEFSSAYYFAQGFCNKSKFHCSYEIVNLNGGTFSPFVNTSQTAATLESEKK